MFLSNVRIYKLKINQKEGTTSLFIYFQNTNHHLKINNNNTSCMFINTSCEFAVLLLNIFFSREKSLIKKINKTLRKFIL